MIYLFYSQDAEMARTQGQKFLRKAFPTRSEGNYVSFNMADTPLRELVDECNAISLMSEKKAIFAENCAFLAKAGKTNKNSKDKDVLALAEYCNYPNPDIDLFLIVYAKEIDLKNPVVDAISKHGQIKEIPIPKKEEWVEQVKRYMNKRGHEIEFTAAEMLVDRVDGDYGRFIQELAKLDAYAENEVITTKDIALLVAPKLEEDTFTLSNALISNDIQEALSVYQDLKVHSNDEIRLINMLASQFRFLDEVYQLASTGMNKFDIAKELGASPYRVEISMKNIRSIKRSSIVKILERLYRCEKSILSGEVNASFAFTRFLAETTL